MVTEIDGLDLLADEIQLDRKDVYALKYMIANAVKQQDRLTDEILPNLVEITNMAVVIGGGVATAALVGLRVALMHRARKLGVDIDAIVKEVGL